MGNPANYQHEKVREIGSMSTWCRDLLLVPSLLLGQSQGRAAHHLIRPLDLNMGQAPHSWGGPTGQRTERFF